MSRICCWLLGLSAAASAAEYGDVFFSPDAPTAPKCFFTKDGRTVVQYDRNVHTSFKCSHVPDPVAKACNPDAGDHDEVCALANGAQECGLFVTDHRCTWGAKLNCKCTAHPTHHVGGCKQFSHTNNKLFHVGGSCPPGQTTAAPTVAPTAFPTPAPTDPPTPAPTPYTDAPTVAPTAFPTPAPTDAPTPAPTPYTDAPTVAPTAFPTPAPTNPPTPVPPTPAPTPVQCPCGTYLQNELAGACAKCDPGTFGPCDNQCHPCPAGTFAAAMGSAACTTCSAGFASAEEASACNKCLPGRFAATAGEDYPCDQCPMGKKSVDDRTSCEACAVGTYSNAEAEVCDACVAGTWSPAEANICDDCAPGTERPLGASNGCQACQAGYIAPGHGTAACAVCAAGQASSADRLSCQLCPLNTFAPKASGACLPCANGEYSGVGAAKCNNCDPGFYPNPASVEGECIACEGTVQYAIAASGAVTASCNMCEAGTYRVGDSCPDCAAGTWSADGAKVCALCDAGHISGAAAGQCTPCAAGTRSNDARTKCIPCAVHHTSVPGKDACAPCADNHWTMVVGSKDCELCPGGRQSQGGSTCTKCPAGTSRLAGSSAGCVDCAPGFRSGVGAHMCTPCPRGWGPGPVTGTCEPCPAGTGSATGDASCAKCPAGYHSSFQNHFATSGTVCKPCDAGFFSAAEGSEACTACAAGSVSQGASSACTTCVKGTHADNSRAICKPCDAGFFSATEGAEVCTACPAASSFAAGADQTSATYCTACPAGTHTLGSAMMSQCLACAAGRFGSGDQATDLYCQDCAQGWWSAQATAGACTGCAAGKYGYGNDHSCETCHCKPCTSGSQTNKQVGATTCTACAPGRFGFGQQHNANYCSDCPSGEYQPAFGQDVCIACLEGRFGEGEQTSANYCKKCEKGTYQSFTGTTTCVACARGRFGHGDQTLMSYCKDCAAGSVAAAEKALKCTACLVPTEFVATAGMHTCDATTSCTADQYQTTEPTTSSNRQCQPLTVCQPGEYESVAPTLTLDRQCETGEATCPEGQFESKAPTPTSDRVCTAYTNCADGYLMSVTGSPSSDRQCEKCPSGRFQGAADGVQNEAFCHACAAGQSTRGDNGMSACIECRAHDRVQPQTGKAYCNDVTTCVDGNEYEATSLQWPIKDRSCYMLTVCLSNEYEETPPTANSDRVCLATGATCTDKEFEFAAPTASSDRVCKPISPACQPGSFLAQAATATADRVCGTCTKGFFSDSANVPACTPCGPGFYQDDNEAQSCKSCEKGSAQPETSTAASPVVACTQCPTGTKAPSKELAFCIECPPGRSSDAVGARTCIDCAKGRFSDNPGAKACEACSSGHFMPDAGAMECDAWTDCGEGTVEDAAGTTVKDRTCKSKPVAKKCAAHEYEVAPATATTNTVCASVAVCDFAVQYQSKAPTKTSDRECTAITKCAPGRYESIKATQAVDCACSPCPLGTYKSEAGKGGKYGFALIDENGVEKAGYDQCTLCPVGKVSFSGEGGQTSINDCQPCDNGAIATPNPMGYCSGGEGTSFADALRDFAADMNVDQICKMEGCPGWLCNFMKKTGLKSAKIIFDDARRRRRLEEEHLKHRAQNRAGRQGILQNNFDEALAAKTAPSPTPKAGPKKLKSLEFTFEVGSLPNGGRKGSDDGQTEPSNGGKAIFGNVATCGGPLNVRVKLIKTGEVCPQTTAAPTVAPTTTVPTTTAPTTMVPTTTAPTTAAPAPTPQAAASLPCQDLLAAAQGRGDVTGPFKCCEASDGNCAWKNGKSWNPGMCFRFAAQDGMGGRPSGGSGGSPVAEVLVCPLLRLQDAARAAGVQSKAGAFGLLVNSGFRMQGQQQDYLYNCFLAGNRLEAEGKDRTQACNQGHTAAKPGTSRSERGYQVNFNILSSKPDEQPNYVWMKAQAWKYGWRHGNLARQPFVWWYDPYECAGCPSQFQSCDAPGVVCTSSNGMPAIAAVGGGRRLHGLLRRAELVRRAERRAERPDDFQATLQQKMTGVNSSPVTPPPTPPNPTPAPLRTPPPTPPGTLGGNGSVKCKATWGFEVQIAGKVCLKSGIDLTLGALYKSANPGQVILEGKCGYSGEACKQRLFGIEALDMNKMHVDMTVQANKLRLDEINFAGELKISRYIQPFNGRLATNKPWPASAKLSEITFVIPDINANQVVSLIKSAGSGGQGPEYMKNLKSASTQVRAGLAFSTVHEKLSWTPCANCGGSQKIPRGLSLHMSATKMPSDAVGSMKSVDFLNNVNGRLYARIQMGYKGAVLKESVFGFHVKNVVMSPATTIVGCGAEFGGAGGSPTLSGYIDTKTVLAKPISKTAAISSSIYWNKGTKEFKIMGSFKSTTNDLTVKANNKSVVITIRRLPRQQSIDCQVASTNKVMKGLTVSNPTLRWSRTRTTDTASWGKAEWAFSMLIKASWTPEIAVSISYVGSKKLKASMLVTDLKLFNTQFTNVQAQMLFQKGKDMEFRFEATTSITQNQVVDCLVNGIKKIVGDKPFLPKVKAAAKKFLGSKRGNKKFSVTLSLVRNNGAGGQPQGRRLGEAGLLGAVDMVGDHIKLRFAALNSDQSTQMPSASSEGGGGAAIAFSAPLNDLKNIAIMTEFPKKKNVPSMAKTAWHALKVGLVELGSSSPQYAVAWGFTKRFDDRQGNCCTAAANPPVDFRIQIRSDYTSSIPRLIISASMMAQGWLEDFMKIPNFGVKTISLTLAVNAAGMVTMFGLGSTMALYKGNPSKVDTVNGNLPASKIVLGATLAGRLDVEDATNNCFYFEILAEFRMSKIIGYVMGRDLSGWPKALDLVIKTAMVGFTSHTSGNRKCMDVGPALKPMSMMYDFSAEFLGFSIATAMSFFVKNGWPSFSYYLSIVNNGFINDLQYGIKDRFNNAADVLISVCPGVLKVLCKLGVALVKRMLFFLVDILFNMFQFHHFMVDIPDLKKCLTGSFPKMGLSFSIMKVKISINIDLGAMLGAVKTFLIKAFKALSGFAKKVKEVISNWINDVKSKFKITTKSCAREVCGCNKSPTCTSTAKRILAGCAGKCCKYHIPFTSRRRSCHKSRTLCGYSECKAWPACGSCQQWKTCKNVLCGVDFKFG